jgi:hypothetical protein
VGAAARVVHAGCGKALRNLARVEPVVDAAEGAPYTVAPGYSPARIKLVGNVAGTPPYRGTIVHAGWRASNLSLPTLLDNAEPEVLCQAEVSL